QVPLLVTTSAYRELQRLHLVAAHRPLTISATDPNLPTQCHPRRVGDGELAQVSKMCVNGERQAAGCAAQCVRTDVEPEGIAEALGSAVGGEDPVHLLAISLGP